MEEIKLHFIGNAGVMLEYKNVKIIVDGLYEDRNNYFSNIPEKTLKEMIAGNGNFANADCLLFSHAHEDHFNKEYLIYYLKNNVVSFVMLPEESEISESDSHFVSSKDRVYINEEVIIEPFSVRHVDKKFYDVKVNCFIITMGEKTIAVLSDADYCPDMFVERLVGVDVTLVTPLFYNNQQGRKILNEKLHTQKTIIYHVPFDGDDQFGYYKIACYDVKKYAQNGNVVIMNRHKETFIL